MENTDIVVCKVVYYDRITRKLQSPVGKIRYSDVKNFKKDNNGFIMLQDTNFLISKDDIREIVLYRAVKRWSKPKNELSLYDRNEQRFGTVAF